MGEPGNIDNAGEQSFRREREISRLRERAVEFARTVFSEQPDGEARIAKLHENLGYFETHLGQDIDIRSIFAEIDALRDVDEAELFVARTVAAIEPLLEHQVDHPDVARQIFHERHDFTPLNEVLSYGLTEDGYVAHIHLAPATDIKNLRTVVVDGLRELARRITADPEGFVHLDRIAASSWIITEHPRIMEKLGFTIDGPVSEESAERARQHGESRPATRAHIDRADFLARYGSAS